MRKLIVIGVLSLFAGASQAADIEQGKQVANSRCISCHGKAGISTNPMYPNLAGQQSLYLAKQMRDFQSGKRQEPVMNAMMNGVSEASIEDLAAYFNSLK